jgi:hypothetical protein
VLGPGSNERLGAAHKFLLTRAAHFGPSDDDPATLRTEEKGGLRTELATCILLRLNSIWPLGGQKA